MYVPHRLRSVVSLAGRTRTALACSWVSRLLSPQVRDNSNVDLVLRGWSLGCAHTGTCGDPTLLVTVGDLRWKAPVPPAAYGSNYDALMYKPACAWHCVGVVWVWACCLALPLTVRHVVQATKPTTRSPS